MQEKKKNGNCKAFSVTHKRNKDFFVNKLSECDTKPKD